MVVGALAAVVFVVVLAEVEVEGGPDISGRGSIPGYCIVL